VAVNTNDAPSQLPRSAVILGPTLPNLVVAAPGFEPATQPSAESNGGGLFTCLVCSALDGGTVDVRGKVTAPAVYSYVDEALGPWDQRPVFKSHVSKLIPLRHAPPSVGPDTLRRFPILFQIPDSEFPLDPS